MKIFILKLTGYVFLSFLFFYHIAPCVEIEKDRTIQVSDNLKTGQENASDHIYGTLQTEAADSYRTKKNDDLECLSEKYL